MNAKVIFGLVFIFGYCQAKGQSHKVQCTDNLMRISVGVPNDTTAIYLEGLKGYNNEKCKPQIADELATFELSLIDFYDCGLMRIVNKLTEKKTFYHKIIIETESGKDIVSVKCITVPTFNSTDTRVRRDVLPAGFSEPEDLEITTSLDGKAPEPILKVSVKQGGNLVSGDLNVSPGTPLQMEIYLDETSAPVYGLGVSVMEVTDTKSQEETIIFNGCSVDPYLFENFNTIEGDLLTAKFRAFKFPDSPMVQFRGTVNVCLDKCRGVECSNGQTGYGRKRREISSSDSNKIYEINLTTFIRVNYEEGSDKNTIDEIEDKIKQLKIANQKLARNSRENVFESVQATRAEMNSNTDDTAKVEETVIFTKEVIENSTNTFYSNIFVTFAAVIVSIIRFL